MISKIFFLVVSILKYPKILWQEKFKIILLILFIFLYYFVFIISIFKDIINFLNF